LGLIIPFFEPRLVNIAIIGAGNMASEHCKAFGRLGCVQLVGIYSRTRHRAESLANKYSIIRVFDSIDEMYFETKADLVLICVKELELIQVCKKSFHFPWMHLIEKPIGHDVAEARTLRQMSLEQDARVYAAFNRRFYSSTLQAMAGLQGETSPRLVSILDQEDPVSALAAGQPKAVVENWMFANSIHVIDLFRLFCRGNPTTVRPMLPWRGLGTELVSGEVVFDSGDVGLYQAVWNRPGPWSVTVSTKTKRLEMRPLEKLTCQLAGSRVAQEIEIDPVDLEFKPGLVRMAEGAVAAVRGLPTELPTIECSLASMELVAALYGKEA
jgi:predicted dehydrogenase